LCKTDGPANPAAIKMQIPKSTAARAGMALERETASVVLGVA
jgi:hypothetical protein